jgi:glycosyltransferase involved in cell wall biosynthesis
VRFPAKPCLISAMKLSVIIPAFNEAKRIEACLNNVSAALQANARPFLTTEVIVADNNSTDATAELARRAGARVVFEPVNQIARARNAGAKAATGDWFLFLDADTLLRAPTVTEMLGFIESGNCVGGGTVLQFDKTPVLARGITAIGNILIRCLKWTCGCFIFCRANAFRDFGGFNEEFFAGEDVEFGKAMKRWGRLRGLQVALVRAHPPVTSSRKLELYSAREVTTLILRYLLFPKRTTRDKSRLAIFYDGRR